MGTRLFNKQSAQIVGTKEAFETREKLVKGCFKPHKGIQRRWRQVQER